MAGSIAWFEYVADSGVIYAVAQDESNALLAGFAPYADANPRAKLPTGMRMRYVNVLHPATGAKRRISVGSPTDGLWTGAINGISLLNQAAVPPAAVNFVVTSRVGEKRMGMPHEVDTGLLTG